MYPARDKRVTGQREIVQHAKEQIVPHFGRRFEPISSCRAVDFSPNLTDIEAHPVFATEVLLFGGFDPQALVQILAQHFELHVAAIRDVGVILIGHEQHPVELRIGGQFAMNATAQAQRH